MRYFFLFWYRVARLAAYVLRHRKEETKRAYALLDRIEAGFGGAFNPATRRKIAISYGIYTPMVCDAFAALHGRKTNDAEKERYIHYFVCSSLFDDFTDITILPEERLRALSFDTENFNAETFDERVFRASHLLLKDYVADLEAYIPVTRRLFQAQLDSKRQREPDVPDDALREITFEKGGCSVLLCSFYLDLPVSEAERKCWYRIGTIIQLTNDLYDIKKDLGDGMETLPDRMTDAHAFEKFFRDQVRCMQGEIRNLAAPEVRKGPFRLGMAGIYSFGLIALDQLRRIQGDAPEMPPLKSLTRKDLVIDMEKIRNLVKWLRYTYAEARL